jgi:hypothetical protein
MMIERSCMFVAMVMTMSISAGIIHAAKDTESIVIKYDAAAAAADSDSLLRGHRRVDGEDCLSISKYYVLFFSFVIDGYNIRLWLL